MFSEKHVELHRSVHYFRLVLSEVRIVDTETHMPIARQRLGKHIPEVTLSTIEGHPSLGNGPINTHS
jgi:hypothetical protein